MNKRGVNVFKLDTDGTLTFLNAHEGLARFMVDGLPNRQLFLASVGALVAAAKQVAKSETRGLTVFGEMVAVLWEQGNKTGALQLEALWNDVLNDHAFHLHCAYPRSLFQHDADAMGMRAICDEHSHVLGHAVN